MNHKLTQRFAAIATTVSMLLAVPGVALAQTEPADARTAESERPEGLDRLKNRALTAIDKRLEAIARWSERVENNEHLTAAHQSVLESDLDSASRGLSALASDIEEATTYSELGALIPKIVEDYWVFALLGPQVHLVVAADHMAHVAGRFEGAAVTIQAAIDRAGEAGFETASAQDALDRMSAHLAAGSLLIDPVARTVLDVQPGDMPEAGDQLRSAHADLKSARQEFRAARQAAQEAVKALRDAINP
jgi:hypothetical protein